MTKPGKNSFIYWFFHYYIRWIIKRNFYGVNFNQVTPQPDKSVLLLANHFSWWDGFLMYYVNYKLLRKKFHVLILEDTIRQAPFMKHLGAFSIIKKSKNMMESLTYAAQLLDSPQNLVLLFPQGKLYSNFTDDVRFEKGLSKITALAEGKFQYLFAATFVESFQHKKPTARIYLKTGIPTTIKNITDVNEAYQQHYQSAKLLQTQIVI